MYLYKDLAWTLNFGSIFQDPLRHLNRYGQKDLNEAGLAFLRFIVIVGLKEFLSDLFKLLNL